MGAYQRYCLRCVPCHGCLSCCHCLNTCEGDGQVADRVCGDEFCLDLRDDHCLAYWYKEPQQCVVHLHQGRQSHNVACWLGSYVGMAEPDLDDRRVRFVCSYVGRGCECDKGGALWYPGMSFASHPIYPRRTPRNKRLPITSCDSSDAIVLNIADTCFRCPSDRAGSSAGSFASSLQLA